jgi:hypothetical protein
MQLISPKTYQPIAALTYMQKQRLLSIKPGDEWIVELTFDDGKRKKLKDLRPDLLLVIRYERTARVVRVQLSEPDAWSVLSS